MITCKRIYNKELIKSIIFTQTIWDCVAEDGQSKEDFEPNVDSECWLLMSNEENIVGLYNLHGINVITVQIHAHVLPEYRKEYSRETGVAALNYLLANTEYKKVIAIIPVIYENVKKFTESFGFIVEGVNRLSYQKNMELIDQWMLGATRGEIIEVLNG